MAISRTLCAIRISRKTLRRDVSERPKCLQGQLVAPINLSSKILVAEFGSVRDRPVWMAKKIHQT